MIIIDTNRAVAKQIAWTMTISIDRDREVTEYIFENDYWDGVPDDQEFPFLKDCTNLQQSCRWVQTFVHRYQFSLSVLNLSFDS
jgi:hypothetical protein